MSSLKVPDAYWGFRVASLQPLAFSLFYEHTWEETEGLRMCFHFQPCSAAFRLYIVPFQRLLLLPTTRNLDISIRWMNYLNRNWRFTFRKCFDLEKNWVEKLQNIFVLILIVNVWPLSSTFWASLPIAAFLQINAKTFISYFLGNLAHLQHLKVQIKITIFMFCIELIVKVF